MAGSIQYRNEQFIKQYEHIKSLKLLSDEELAQLKRKRSSFEISIQRCSELRPYIDYIKYEIALMQKFRQIDYKNFRDGIALDRAMANHIKDLFRLALKKFRDKRKLWEHYLAFAKQKFRNLVSVIYQEMLCFHRKPEDFIEAADHETERKNFTVALNLLVQGIGVNKEACETLVVAYIVCSIKQGSEEGTTVQEAILLQASKFYMKFLKDCENVSFHCDLLRRIQEFEFSLPFQNDVIADLLKTSSERPEVWNLLAERHLEKLFYDNTNLEKRDDEEDEKPKIIPFEECVDRAVKIYERGLNSVSDGYKPQMFTFFIDKLMELDNGNIKETNILKTIRITLGKTLTRGFEEKKLSSRHFILFTQLLMVNLEKNRTKVEEMLETGLELYPKSMELSELAIKYHLHMKSYENVKKVFNQTIANNEKCAVELYRFLCGIYLKNTEDKEKASCVMLEAMNSQNKQLSEAFQPYCLEYLALTDGIEKARQIFNSQIASKTTGSLSLDFFRMMIKLEEAQEKPKEKFVLNCYERATEHFGKENAEIWLEFIKYLWKVGKHFEADELRKRAMMSLKDDLSKVEEFEKRFTMLRNETGMEVDTNE